MHIFSLRRIIRSLHVVKYSVCGNCGEPISSSSSLHSCNPVSIPLTFSYTKLTESSRSIHFNDRMSGISFLHEIKIWASDYITGIEVTIEDIQNKKFQTFRRGSTTDKFYRFSMENGEFIDKIEYGCDVHGLYYLSLTSGKKNLSVGDRKRPRKIVVFPEGSGVVGLFGGHTDIVLHLGFYFDNCKKINWERHRNLMLIRKKGQASRENYLSFILKLDDQLFRYLSTFV